MCNIGENISQCWMKNASIQTALDVSINGETYWERSLAFLIIGIIGILANAFVIIILCSSVKIRQKLVNTLIIHQSFVDFLASVALAATAHLSPCDQHGLDGVHANIYCFFVMNKWPLWLLIFTSSFSLMFLNIERYISIVVASSFVPVNGVCDFGPTSYHITMSHVILILFIVDLLHFFLPVFLVMILYGHMIIRLKRNVKSKHDVGSEKRDDIMEKAKKNIFKTMLLITVCYAVCFSLNSIYIVLLLRGLVIITGKHCDISILN